MPTYEYECKKCGRFEQFQRITEPKLTKCPTCKKPVKRLLGSGAGIIFKGSGFYQTDYRSESYKRASKSDSSSAAGTGAAASSGGTAGGTTPAAGASAGSTPKKPD